jgi:4-amino-4-deoxy-L-arabinose transferase-like glycosyltransferase
LLALAGLTAVGVAVRFSSLGLQSYHHDEVITAGRVLPGSFLHMLREVRLSESNPPLYYVIAWAWAKAFGTHEVGLRSLSALFGAATIPVAYLIGKELRSTRAGLITAAMVAVNPMLIWYSQEARSYALLVLLSAASLLFFLRARRTADSSDLAYWALFSMLALWSHYFAVFPVAIEAAWLVLDPRTRRRALAASGIVGLFGLMLAPLAIEQANPHHIGWIADSSLGTRAVDTAASFMIGETGQVIAEPPRNGYAIVPGILVGIGLALALALQGRGARRPAASVLVVGGGTVLLAAGAAIAGKDYVIARNLLPALIPLLAVAALGFAGPRLAYTGVVLAVALCAYWLAFDVRVDATPNLQRPDWRDLTAQIGSARVPRAVVAWKLAADPLEFYLRDGSQRVYGGEERVREVDVVAKPWVRRRPAALPFAFRRVGRDRAGRLTLTRYRAPRPTWLRIRSLKRIGTGFGANGVLVANAASLADSTVLRSSLAGALRR